MSMYLIKRRFRYLITLFFLCAWSIKNVKATDPLYAKKYAFLSFIKAEMLKRLLFQAAIEGNEQHIIEAIKRNAQLNSQDEQGNTPLMIAVIKGHYTVVEALVLAGALLSTKNNVDKTALDYALIGKNKNIVTLLLKSLKSTDVL